MKHIRRATALAVFTMAASMTSAWATSEASASISLTYTLIDLAPESGLTPFFRLAPEANIDDATAVYALVAPLGGSSLVASDSQPIGGQALSLSQGTGPDVFSASATPTAWAVFGQAAGLGVHYQGGASSAASTGYFPTSSLGADGFPAYTGMELSANSVLLIRATVDLHAAVSSAANCGEQACPHGTGDDASVDLSIGLYRSAYYSDGSLTSDNTNNQRFALSGAATNIGYYTDVLNPDTGDYEWVWQEADASMTSFSDHREVTFVLTNNTPRSAYASLWAQVSAYGNAAALPDLESGGTGVPGIPEPATWATMGLGLLGLAAATRRRQRQA